MGSVYENIIYGNHGFDCSIENVQKAAKIANAFDFI
jgi:ABC-type multidrug transport system fused ATPase/permease subunit